MCIITENPVFIHAWFRPPLGFADATSRFPSGWVSALAWTWAKIMFGMVQKKISCMCMYIYIHIIPYIYTLWRMGFILFQHVWYQNGAGYELRNRHLHGTALRWSCSPFCYFQNKFFPVSMRTCYIYSVWYCILYIYMYNYSFNEDLPACHGWMETTWFENTSPSKSLRKDCSFWLVWIMYLFMWFM